MVKLGHKVTVLCQTPSYPIGSYYNGFTLSWLSREKISPNLTILRSANFANKRISLFQKLSHYFVFMFSAMINSLKIKKPDLVIVSSPPLFVGLVGMFYKKIKSSEFWLDLRDLWPESAQAIGQMKKGFFYKIGKKIELAIYESAKGFIVPVPSFDNYLKKIPKNKNKPVLSLVNGVSKDYLDIVKCFNAKKNSSFTILYSGNIGYAQDLFTLIDVANELSDFKIKFKIIGDGANKDSVINYARKCSNISIQSSMPRYDLVSEIMSSSICIVPLINSPLFDKSLPSKIFEYMACGKPIIASIDGDVKNLLNVSSAGIFVEPENSLKLTEAIIYYYNHPEKRIQDGKNGKLYVEKNLIKENLIKTMFNIMQDCN